MNAQPIVLDPGGFKRGLRAADDILFQGQSLAAQLQALANLAGAGQGVIYPTLAALSADLAHPPGTLGVVYNDGANSGYYAKSGASGGGSWALSLLTSPAQAASAVSAQQAQAAAGSAIASSGFGQFATKAAASAIAILAALSSIVIARPAAAGPPTQDTYQQVSANPGHSASFQDKNGQWWEIATSTASAESFGAIGDCVTFADGSITAGQSTLNTASSVSAVVGQNIWVAGAGASGAPLITTITGIATASLMLATPASATVSGAAGGFGTDDQPALASASVWLNAKPNRRLNLYRAYYIGQRTQSVNTTTGTQAWAQEGALTLLSQKGITVDFGGRGRLIMANLSSTGAGVQFHGIWYGSNGAPGGHLTLLHPRVEWIVQPTSRSQGDGIHLYGYPSATGCDAKGNYTVTNIKIVNSYVKWAPQAGLIMFGCSEVEVTFHHSEQTSADGFHVNACYKVRAGTISGFGTGDDVCAFVTYYSTTNNAPLYGQAGSDPYCQATVAGVSNGWSNDGCKVDFVISINGTASGLRFAGSYRVHVGKVVAVGCQQAFITDGGLQGTGYSWSNSQSFKCSVAEIHSEACSVGVIARSFNSTQGTTDSQFTTGDVSIGRAIIRASTSQSFSLAACAGLHVGSWDIDGRSFGATSIEGVDFGDLTARNYSDANPVLVGRTNPNGSSSAAAPGSRPDNLITLGAVNITGGTFELHDMTAWDGLSFVSKNSPGNGLYITNPVRGGFKAGIHITNCNRGNNGTAIGVYLGGAQRWRSPGPELIHDAATLTNAMQIGGGGSPGSLLDIRFTSRGHEATSLTATAQTLVVQGGANGPTQNDLSILWGYYHSAGMSAWAYYDFWNELLPPVAVTYSSSIQFNAAAGKLFLVTLTGNLTVAQPSGMRAGQEFYLELTQDSTGSRTVSWNGYFTFPGGVKPVLSTAPGAVDLIHCIYDGNKIRADAKLAYA